jgi:hypothetical protein
MKHSRNALSVCATLALLLVVGCTSSMTPGKMERVQVTSDTQHDRVGNVYLLRGWIGIFSAGIDNLTAKINEHGVRAQQYQDDQWSTLADAIVAKYHGVKNPEPLCLVGHSYGADDVVRIAKRLKEDGIAVDLLITLDPVTPPAVPSNVRECLNLYQSNGAWDTMPWLRGVPMKLADDASPQHTQLANWDIRKEHTELLEPGTDHFNVEKKGKIHDKVIEQVIGACPTRDDWTAMQRGPTTRPLVVVPINKVPTTKPNTPIAVGHSSASQ